MIEDGFYIGSDLKLRIDISAPGFDQYSDDYIIDLYCDNELIRTFTQDDIKYSGEYFYLPIPTEGFRPGFLRLVVTALVPDSDFSRGIRKEIAVKKLKYIKEIP